MTNEEIDRRVAEEVMKFEYIQRTKSSNRERWHDGGMIWFMGERPVFGSIWHPTTSIEQAWMVVGEIQRRRLVAEFEKAVLRESGGSIWYVTDVEETCHNLCLASLKAVEEGE